MTGSIGLIVLNLILFAMLVLGWQLWRQSVPKKRKVNTAEVADWPSGATAVADAPQGAVDASSVAHDQVAYDQVAYDQTAPPVAPVAVAPVPQLVGADASAGNSGFAAPDSSADLSTMAQPTMAQQTMAQQQPTPADPASSSFAAPVQSGVIDDDELAALLDSAPPTAVAPVPAAVPTAVPAAMPSAPVASHTPTTPSSLFSSPATAPAAAAPVSSLAPPVLETPAPSAASDTTIGDDVSRQVSALLAAPSASAQPVVASTPASSLPPIPSSAGSSDRLRLDITGRPVDDVMRSLATRLGEMSYSATSGPSGETVFQRGTSESIRIAVSAQEMTSTDANGRPLPGRADIEVVGGQLQETTEAVLFELLDHGFQLRWAVAGELVLSSFDGALARVNVNPTVSA